MHSLDCKDCPKQFLPKLHVLDLVSVPRPQLTEQTMFPNVTRLQYYTYKAYCNIIICHKALCKGNITSLKAQAVRTPKRFCK